jgi:hypothetical protein
MTDTIAAIAVYDNHSEAEDAVRELQKSGFDMKKLSVVGKDYHTDEHVVGYYNAGDRMKYWGKQGAFWGGFWGLLFGAGFFWVPGIGPLLVGAAGGLARRRPRGRSARRRFECSRRRPLKHRHTKRQHRKLRGSHQGRRVPGGCSWNLSRGGQGQRDFEQIETSPCGGSCSRPCEGSDSRLIAS